MTFTQGSPEWHAARREGVTSTDITSILGINPWTSEGDVARLKLGYPEPEPDAATARRFRLGLALEDVVRGEDVIEHGIAMRRVRRFIVRPDDPLLRTSLDFERVGEKTIVEVKTSTSREWDHGLPEYVEAQVRWQMGVAGYPRAHVAALRYGQSLVCYDVEHDPVQFEGLVTIARDFWARVQAGGPFSESRASVSRAYPIDDGSTVDADNDEVEAILALMRTRSDIAVLKDLEENLELAIKTRMGPATAMVAPGVRVTWKRTRDIRQTDWAGVAADALEALGDPIAVADTIGRHTTERPGVRRFVVKKEGISDAPDDAN